VYAISLNKSATVEDLYRRFMATLVASMVRLVCS